MQKYGYTPCRSYSLRLGVSMDKEKTTQDKAMQLGLSQFEMGVDGYPVPGKIVKQYRERMIYVDHAGRKRHWTQKDLAEKLGISEVMVNLMEKHNQGLDSIERRRALSILLKIPPVLLGLGSLDQIVEIAVGKHALTPTPERVIKIDTIQSYQKAYDAYKRMYKDGLSYAIVYQLEGQTYSIDQKAKKGSTDALLRLLWQYEILCAKVFSSDLANWRKTFEHVDNAKDIASYLDDNDLQAASLCYSAIFHFRQKRIGLAKMDVDAAAMYAKGSTLQTKGSIFSKSACIYAEHDRTTTGTTIALNMLDSAEKYIDKEEEAHAISFGSDDFLLDKSYVLQLLNRHGKALDILDDAEKHVQAAGKRHMVFLDIKRAQSYIEQKKPEYEQAIWMLINAIETSKEIKVARNIDQVQKLYSTLAQSSYRNAPDVIDLEQALRNVRVT